MSPKTPFLYYALTHWKSRAHSRDRKENGLSWSFQRCPIFSHSKKWVYRCEELGNWVSAVWRWSVLSDYHTFPQKAAVTWQVQTSKENWVLLRMITPFLARNFLGPCQTWMKNFCNKFGSFKNALVKQIREKLSGRTEFPFLLVRRTTHR